MRKFSTIASLSALVLLALSLAVSASATSGNTSNHAKPVVNGWKLLPRIEQAPVSEAGLIRLFTPCTTKWIAPVRVFTLPGVEKPFYLEHRLLDLDVRSVTSSFGALVASSARCAIGFMSVDVRVGNYHLDSSNFISEDGFQGFLGSTGQVRI